MTIQFKFDNSKLKTKLGRLAQAEQAIMPQLYQYFVAQTPIDTGNARNNTTLNGNTINANYPYAERLDQGYSKQSPMGMSHPSEIEAERLIRAYVKKNGAK